MYVDSSDVCNDIGFNIGSGTSTVTRAWTIKVKKNTGGSKRFENKYQALKIQIYYPLLQTQSVTDLNIQS